VRLFPLERVFAEIDWIVRDKIEYVYCADANFCLFSRDEKIVDYVLEQSKEHGYPKYFHVNYTKNRTEFVFDISTRMVRGGLAKAQTIAFQSMDPHVLENIGRKNMSPAHFRQLMRRFNENHIATYSELILGLPGETYASFCSGMCSLIENGQHFAVYVYPCEIFPNSEISQEAYRKKFSIGTTRVPFLLMHSNAVPAPGAVTEYVELLTSSATMTRMDWARTYVFATFVQGLHNVGFSRALAMYLRQTHGFGYLDFYGGLLSYMAAHPQTKMGALYNRILSLCVGVAEGENAFMAPCEGTNNVLWSFEEIVCIEIARDPDAFYGELFAWTDSLFGGDPVLPSLYRYQRDIIKKYGLKDIEITSPYDFYSFFEAVYLGEPQPLRKTPIRITLQDPCPVGTLADYAREVIWYGRNRQMADYTGHYYDIRCEALPSDSESVS
jgi:putative methyltransferase